MALHENQTRRVLQGSRCQGPALLRWLNEGHKESGCIMWYSYHREVISCHSLPYTDLDEGPEANHSLDHDGVGRWSPQDSADLFWYQTQIQQFQPLAQARPLQVPPTVWEITSAAAFPSARSVQPQNSLYPPALASTGSRLGVRSVSPRSSRPRHDKSWYYVTPVINWVTTRAFVQRTRCWVSYPDDRDWLSWAASMG